MKRAELEETKAVLRQADAAYRGYSCPGTAECCRLKETGLQPWLWPSEWALLREHLKAEGRPLPPPRADGACPFLVDGRCSVYSARPFGCRTYYCHRATGPKREPVERTGELLDRLRAIHAEGGEPKPILDWYEAADDRSDAAGAGPAAAAPADADRLRQ